MLKKLQALLSDSLVGVRVAAGRLNMHLRNVGSILLLAFSAWSCASTTHTPPFEQQSESGLTFWIFSPLADRYVYAFHWDDDMLLVARSTESGLAYDEVPIDSCPLLASYLILLKESVLDSVEIVFVRKPAIPVTEVITGGPLYRVRYAPDRFTTTVQLEGGEGGEVPWFAAARTVREREAECAGNR